MNKQEANSIADNLIKLKGLEDFFFEYSALLACWEDSVGMQLRASDGKLYMVGWALLPGDEEIYGEIDLMDSIESVLECCDDDKKYEYLSAMQNAATNLARQIGVKLGEL